jgi:pyridinium-3,5-biscarboxylic acid mononucleotide synthase
MQPDHIKKILDKVQQGELDAAQAYQQLKHLPFENMGFAHVDHHRAMRCGFPEVIFCLGKTDAQVIGIAQKILDAGSSLLATRARISIYRKLKRKYKNVIFNKDAQAIYLKREPGDKGRGQVLVLSAGTSDIPVAEEAAITAEVMGNRVRRIYDVGVAGIHRLFAHRADIEKSKVIIVVAGMEGALASVVGGLASKPIIAVPTSVGYGASFKGVAALLGMLTSCAAGVAVVNIDNGFGAGYIASLINRKEEK